jgi:hypothetical protein
MWTEAHDTGWYGIEHAIESLSGCRFPVVNIIGLDDEWVTVDEVRRVLDVTGAGPRLVVQLPHVTHSVSRNLVALRSLLGELTRLALNLPDNAELVTPTFEEILDVRTLERRRERAESAITAPG